TVARELRQQGADGEASDVAEDDRGARAARVLPFAAAALPEPAQADDRAGPEDPRREPEGVAEQRPRRRRLRRRVARPPLVAETEREADRERAHEEEVARPHALAQHERREQEHVERRRRLQEDRARRGGVRVGGDEGGERAGVEEAEEQRPPRV